MAAASTAAAASSALGSAQVQFMDERLALVHIPLDTWPLFLDPILKLLLLDAATAGGQSPSHRRSGGQDDGDGGDDDDEEEEDEGDEDDDDGAGKAAGTAAFINVSVTPIECSIACPRRLAEEYFVPVMQRLGSAASASSTDSVLVSSEDYEVMQVEGQGLDACRRVLELTSPLAMAGISIFFISTYFSDYILFPTRDRGRVVRALEARGFAFEAVAGAFVAAGAPSQDAHEGGPDANDGCDLDVDGEPSTTVSELQARTFALLRERQIHARVDESLRIVQCAGRYQDADSTARADASILRSGVIEALVLDRPRFLSLTMTAADPAPSILLETRSLPRFDQPRHHGRHHHHHQQQQQQQREDLPSDEGDRSVLIGAKDDVLVPVMFDLRDLPLQATASSPELQVC
ncbi:hypothetical protein KEM52_006093, partial [Ascosphaera acerosa]